MASHQKDVNEDIIFTANRRKLQIRLIHGLSYDSIHFLLRTYTLTEIEFGVWKNNRFCPADGLFSHKYLSKLAIY